MISAGIDAGSRAIKVVLFDSATGRVLGSGVSNQGLEQSLLAEALYEQTLRAAGLTTGDVKAVVATGYGRNRVPFAATTITEITCHACGVHRQAPETRSIIEIGGQDSKVIQLEKGGRVRDFAMNDRCAAGTGRFLEMLASRLNLDVSALGELSERSRTPASISSTCVVFAETEIIGLLAEGIPPEDIAAGVQTSIAQRVAAMTTATLEPPVYFTGGVALQPGMVRALQQVLARPLQVAPQPQFTGALGAAILAASRSSGGL